MKKLILIALCLTFALCEYPGRDPPVQVTASAYTAQSLDQICRILDSTTNKWNNFKCVYESPAYSAGSGSDCDWPETMENGDCNYYGENRNIYFSSYFLNDDPSNAGQIWRQNCSHYCNNQGAPTCDGGCGGNYFKDPAPTTSYCTQCMANCKSCTSATQCNWCAIGYFLNSATTTSCDALGTGCAFGTSATVCTTCYFGYFLSGGACTACTAGSHCTAADVFIICPPGKIKVGTACQTEGTTTSPYCSNYDSTTFNCTACQTGYHLQSGTDCCGQLSGCATHSTGSLSAALTCTTCESGYTKLTGATTCTMCTYPCKTCTASATSCDSCETLFTYYKYDATAHTCTECPSDCDECASAAAGKCTTCDKGFKLNGTSLLCEACVAHCAVCSDLTTCTTCRDGYYKDATNLCVICLLPTTFTYAGITDFTCTGALATTTTVHSCPSGSTFNAAGTNCVVEASCDLHREDARGCFQCVKGFKWDNTTGCTSCGTACPSTCALYPAPPGSGAGANGSNVMVMAIATFILAFLACLLI